MKLYQQSLFAIVAVVSLLLGTPTYAEHGEVHNNCADRGSHDFDKFGSSADVIDQLAAVLDSGIASPDGWLSLEETEVHYKMLVDVDIRSLEEPSLVVVSCNVTAPYRIPNETVARNYRVLQSQYLNNIPKTVEIPLCVGLISDPRDVTGWNCTLRVVSFSDFEERGEGLGHFLEFGGGGVSMGGYTQAEKAPGSTSVLRLSGQMLFAADAPITFVTGQ